MRQRKRRPLKGNIVTASSGFGDLVGKCMGDLSDHRSSGGIDLWHAAEIAEVPAGYYPVAFGINSATDSYGKHMFGLEVFATEFDQAVEALQAGERAMRQAKPRRIRTVLPVFRFSASIKQQQAAELILPLFKRFCFVAQLRGIAGRPMRVQPNN